MNSHILDSIIFSVDQGVHEDTDIANRRQVERLMQRYGLYYENCQGCYNGVTEKSYMLPNGLGHPEIGAFVASTGQEAMLYIDEQWTASLLPFDNNTPRQVLGMFVTVPADEAIRQRGWTKLGGRFYVIKEKE